jgi:hypothetical protein
MLDKTVSKPRIRINNKIYNMYYIDIDGQLKNGILN